MLTSDFDFDLPDELIAQEPPDPRGSSRLLVLDRNTGDLQDRTFADLPGILRPSDLLVLNDTRVFAARLLGRREPSGGAVECLLIRQLPTLSQPSTASSQLPRSGTEDGAASVASCRPGGGSSLWEALVHPGQKLKPGARMLFGQGDRTLHGEVLSRHFQGRRSIRLWTDGADVMDVVEALGHMPLPPYIRRQDRDSDRDRYQTVYARQRGSIAAPTAGLHFTPELLAGLQDRGIERAEITLHVGYGTFKPVRTDVVEEHVVDPEWFTVSHHAAEQLTRARREERRVVAVGTTTTRALESLEIDVDGRVHAAEGETKLFIRPGHTFRLVQGLITNFHLPRSSLLMLVGAFAGRERVLNAYRHAVANRYRFYSYGDAMLIT